MVVLRKVFSVLALCAVANTAAVPNRNRSEIYIRTPQEQDLVDGLLETPLVFGQSNPDKANPEGSFLFSNPAYYALQRYVYNGMQLSKSKRVFESTYNKDQFNEAVGNTNVYDLTLLTFVKINQHCTSFWTNTVGQMSLFAENISLFGRNAGKIYTEMSNRLDIMASIPPDTRATDSAWMSSVVDVYNYAERLQKQMAIAHNQSQLLLKNINNFRAETINDMSNLGQVDRHLNTSNASIYKRVAEHNKDVAHLKSQTESAQIDYDEASRKVSIGKRAYAWIWPIGTIVYLSLSPKWRGEMSAAELRKKAALDELKQTEVSLQTFIQVTDDLKILDMQTDSVLEYIDEAVGLLGNASDAFSHMSASLSAIMVELESESHATNPATIRPNWFSDQSFRMSLLASSEHWAEVYTSAGAFKSNAAITIVPLAEAIELYEQKSEGVFQAWGASSLGRRRVFSMPQLKW
ncbi:hypothetical protein DRE_04671 [Drechslerella stenobrocha 248]|uniref:Enterotoxin n=1 Tax=Drechslerella stenobrocha 248 TaxID=1043628 RepID=W7I0S4_9PEZI|nr:hypothetical protein DRE_04671 [Drechslerella stenobrocha 248]